MAAGDHRRAEIQRVGACAQFAVYDALSHERGACRSGRFDVFESDAPSAAACQILAQALYLYVSPVVFGSDHSSVSGSHAGRRLPNPHLVRQIFRRILGDGKGAERVICRGLTSTKIMEILKQKKVEDLQDIKYPNAKMVKELHSPKWQKLEGDTYFEARYAIYQVERAKSFIAHYYPDIFKELHCCVEATRGQLHDSIGGTYSIFPNDVEYPYMVEVVIGNGQDIKDNDYPKKKIKFPFEDEALSRNIVDLSTSIHEYAHCIFSEYIDPSRRIMAEIIRDEALSLWTLGGALNEGFAAFMELKVLKSMSEDKNLSIADREEAKTMIRVHLKNMHNIFREAAGRESERMVYTEGVFKFMRVLFKRGGMEEIKKFLTAVDINRVYNIGRIWSKEEYEDAFNNPDKIWKLATSEVPS